MNDLFKKFRQTGKIEDYLKYKSEVSKELVEKEKPQNGSKGNSSKKS